MTTKTKILKIDPDLTDKINQSAIMISAAFKDMGDAIKKLAECFHDIEEKLNKKTTEHKHTSCH